MNTKKLMTGISATILLGALAGCQGGNQVSSPVGVTPNPEPTVCQGGVCENPPLPEPPIPINPLPIDTTPIPAPTPLPTLVVCPEFVAGCTGGSMPEGGQSLGQAMGDQTKDVDLQRAALQRQDLATRATALAQRYQMDFQAAVQLTQLSDEVRSLTANGHAMTAQDQSAVATSAFALAGVTAGEVGEAVTRSLSGDNTAEDDLLAKAAANLGMPTATLRDQLLPALGIKP